MRLLPTVKGLQKRSQINNKAILTMKVGMTITYSSFKVWDESGLETDREVRPRSGIQIDLKAMTIITPRRKHGQILKSGMRMTLRQTGRQTP